MRDIAAERAKIDAIVEGKTMCTALLDAATNYPDMVAARWKDASGGWQEITWAQYRDRVRDVTLGLKAIGFAPGEFAVIMSRNRPEHVIADMGVVHARGTPVSLYNTLAPEQIAYAAGHCEATIAFVEDAGFLEKFLKVLPDLPKLRTIVLLEPSEDAVSDLIVTWDELIAKGRAGAAKDFDKSWKAVKPTDVATLIYTSGTTGPPKGVMDTHRNVLCHWEGFRGMVSFKPGERMISYLPLAHAAERCATHWDGILGPFTITFCPDLTQLVPTLVETKPTVFVGVPRVWEKLYAGINAALAAQAEEARHTVQGAIDIGRAVVSHAQRGEAIPDALKAKYETVAPVLEAVRAKVGLDQAWVGVVGAAPIATEVIEFFHALGLPIAEVWGMSELTAVATCNPFDRIKIGSVGPAVAGVEVVLAEDGEILARGGTCMAGYYRDDEKTAEALDDDGWMHTGDIGAVDDDGYFSIIDRKKELIITAGGKNISPANLENALKRHPLIGQACVIGDRRSYLSALIVLDGEVAPAWAAARGIKAGSIAELADHPYIASEIEKAIDEVNEHVSRVENIRKHMLLPAEWTTESDELTPTMKLKRRIIATKYADVIESMYTD